jgi:hypothetical protein
MTQSTLWMTAQETEDYLKSITLPVQILECGCCGAFHPAGPLLLGGSANWQNDCRYDANRFYSGEDFTARTGLPCVEVSLDEQDFQDSDC